MKKKHVWFTVTTGVPFRNFQETHFYVTKSRIDPQSPNDSNHPTIAQAQRVAISFAKKHSGEVIKTTIEDVQV